MTMQWRHWLFLPTLGPLAAAEVGPCDFTPRPLPLSSKEFSALADELDAPEGDAALLSVHLPQQPLVFDLEQLPPSLQVLSSREAVAKQLGGSVWPRRRDSYPPEHWVRLGDHLAEPGAGGDPLYITQYVNDTRLRRLFQTVPSALTGVRRMPVALLARGGEGLRLHALPEARWVLQVHGSSQWRVARPEVPVPNLPSHACHAHPPMAGHCELRPMSLLYVPGKWGWSSCAPGDASQLSLAVGAGAYSGEWPELFHHLAEGAAKSVEALLQENATTVHMGDRATRHTAMDMAAQIGDLKMAKLLREYGARPGDTASPAMLFPLHYAALYGHGDVARWLLEQDGVQPSPRSEEGYCPLHYAAESGHLPVVKALLEAKANVHVTDKQLFAPVHFATRAGHLAVLQQLRDAGAELSSTDGKGCDASIHAAKRGDLSLLAFLLDEEGLSPDSRCDKRDTAAHHAVQLGHVAVLEALKARKANFALKDDRKQTPLHLAVELGEVEVIDWFAAANLKKSSPKKTAGLLHLAAWHGQVRSAEALLRHGADANALEPKSKSPPLEFASTLEVYELLIKNSARVPDGWVHRTASRGKLDLLRALVPTHRDVERALLQAHDGVYPIHMAAQSAQYDVVKWLCGQLGADCSVRSSSKTYGRSPLHFLGLGSKEEDEKSSTAKRVATAKYLMSEVGLRPDDVDDMGITILELAGVTGHLALVKHLLREEKMDPEGLWQAKRAGALNKDVDKWADGFLPKNAYRDWLRLEKPPRQPPGSKEPPPKAKKKRKKGPTADL